MKNPNMKEATHQWLSVLNQNEIMPLLTAFRSADADENAKVMNPMMAMTTEEYNDSNKESASSAPQSVHEGLQTIVNLCRIKSGYNPLDVKGKGTAHYFTDFTQRIADVPCLALLDAQTKTITQESKDANELIESFMSGFDSLIEKDKNKLKKSIRDLAKAALSYAEKQQQLSNFTQSILEGNNNQVYLTLYSSTFEISGFKGKGLVAYHSEYTLHKSQYALSAANWDKVKDLFADHEKTSVEKWLAAMKTPEDANSNMKATCL